MTIDLDNTPYTQYVKKMKFGKVSSSYAQQLVNGRFKMILVSAKRAVPISQNGPGITLKLKKKTPLKNVFMY